MKHVNAMTEKELSEYAGCGVTLTDTGYISAVWQNQSEAERFKRSGEGFGVIDKNGNILVKG